MLAIERAASGLASDVILLLGDRVTPTDGVDDYCTGLREALERRDQRVTKVRLLWKAVGWLPALLSMWRTSGPWRGRWVLVQYTALTWSRRGFSFPFLVVLGLLRRRGVRVGVIFHDAEGHPGWGLLRRVRRACQHWIMRRAYGASERSVLTIPLERVSWLPVDPSRAVFIPVGANILGAREGRPGEHPDAVRCHHIAGTRTTPPRAIAVFGVTGGPAAQHEIDDIASALKHVTSSVSPLELIVFGAGSEAASDALSGALADVDVSVSVLGVLPAERISRILSDSDVLLFVRGTISSGRTSAIAAIAAGTPIVGYSGPATAAPITDAGVMLVPAGDRAALGSALTLVLSDDNLRRVLRRRNVEAHQRYFSWDAIAERFAAEITRG